MKKQLICATAGLKLRGLASLGDFQGSRLRSQQSQLLFQLFYRFATYQAQFQALTSPLELFLEAFHPGLAFDPKVTGWRRVCGCSQPVSLGDVEELAKGVADFDVQVVHGDLTHNGAGVHQVADPNAGDEVAIGHLGAVLRLHCHAVLRAIPGSDRDNPSRPGCANRGSRQHSDVVAMVKAGLASVFRNSPPVVESRGDEGARVFFLLGLKKLGEIGGTPGGQKQQGSPEQQEGKSSHSSP